MTEMFAQLAVPGQHTLLFELNHRINNEFASMIGLVAVAAVRAHNLEVKTALSDVVELLNQHADIHHALKMPDRDVVLDAAEYLRTLSGSISRSKLDRLGIELVFFAETAWLHAERCWKLGMIVHELVTNAARHAFDGREGEIRIELLQAGGFASCKVTDNGSASADVRPGRGLTIVGDLATSLGGHANRSFEATGSTVSVIFPFSQDEKRAIRSAKARVRRSVRDLA